MRLKYVLLAGGVVVAIVGFLLFRPDTLFTNVRVDESLEEAFATPSMEIAEEPMDMDDMADMDDQAMETDVDETMGDEPMDMEDEAMDTEEMDAPAVPEIMQVSQGQFAGIGRYDGAGTAAIYEQDGQYVLRFEDDTDVSNGPDLYVYVLPTDSYNGGDPPDFLDLGRLTGNQGSQNYELPAEFDPDVHQTVLIWCLRFAVPFASAPLG